MRLTTTMAALLLVVAGAAACGDDDGGGGASGDGGAAAASDATLWECTCVGMMEQASGAPRTSEETISECSAGDPAEALTERYDAAARQQGPEFSGECGECADTGEACEPDAE
jgi:hypothetical protein